MTHDQQGTGGARADRLAEQVQALLAAAEQAAAAIRGEAEATRAQAERDALRIRAEAEAQAERVLGEARSEARSLVDRATELVRRLDGDARTAAPSQPAANPQRLAANEEARLMALQMAMAGRSRAEVEVGLHVDDPQAILDDVFGKGTPGDQRIPWSGVTKGEAR